MAQALYRKWRPQTFEQVVGQEHVVRTLRNALTHGRVHHAYLFAGPRGTGKTTTARLLAKAVNCEADDPSARPCNECAICQAVNEGRLIDLIEIDAASNTGVDDVRELRERVGFRPNLARYKVYVIDEVHMLSTSAFNALLKTLEEPPPHAIFVLATTEPQKILPTILSRCQRFDFRRIPLAAIVGRLEHIARQEEIHIDGQALNMVARQATGSMRDAESMLDQLASYKEGGIDVEAVRAALGTGAEEAVSALVDALASGDVARGLNIINGATDLGSDPRQFARQVVQHLRALLLARMGSQETPLHVPDSQLDAFQAQAGRFDPRDLARAIRLFNEAASEARAAWQPQLPLELAFVEAALPGTRNAPPTGQPASPRPAPASPNKPPPAPVSQPSPTSQAPVSPVSPPPATPDPTRPDGPEPDPPAEARLSLQEVSDRWGDLLSAIRSRNLSLEALLRSGAPVAVEESTLVIGFAHNFHKEKVAEDDNRRTVEDAFRPLLGRQVRVRCTLATEQEPRGPAQPPSPSASAPIGEEDELIQAAVEQLGARVVSRSRD
jgi:DNA polymerase-3 subunit gamma/tau